MRALVYHGLKNVSVDEVPDATIERPTDVLVRVTTANICGSDLHMYEGRTDVAEGKVLGHENMGEVIGVGNGVDRVKIGDMVVLPFNIGCGFCKNCESGLTGFCLTANPGNAGAAYGYANMGPYNGGQAELLRCLTPTGTRWSCRRTRGRRRRTTSCSPTFCRPGTTGPSFVGVFVPEDPSAADDLATKGKFAFDFGTFFFKGLSMGTGQANVKLYNRQLRNLIHRDRLSPGVIVSHELNLDQAAEGYRHFDDREDGWTKVILHP
jgi:threonine dehydrogenase-like Zn-dependent dehydrogenase